MERDAPRGIDLVAVRAIMADLRADGDVVGDPKPFANAGPFLLSVPP
jgi:hypothetical protein